MRPRPQFSRAFLPTAPLVLVSLRAGALIWLRMFSLNPQMSPFLLSPMDTVRGTSASKGFYETHSLWEPTAAFSYHVGERFRVII
jgi:hypothetical protein